MATIYYDGYQVTQGTTRVACFWTDMHMFDFRAEKPIMIHSDLKEQVEKFRADPKAFDVTDYNEGTESKKANREYDCLVERNVDRHTLVFMYNGKQYHVQTYRYTKTMEIRKHADKVLEWTMERIECLVSDATGEVKGEGKVLNRVNKLKELEIALY